MVIDGGESGQSQQVLLQFPLSLQWKERSYDGKWNRKLDEQQMGQVSNASSSWKSTCGPRGWQE